MESTFSDLDMFDGAFSENLMTFYNNSYNFFVKNLEFSKSYENKIPNNTLYIDLSKNEDQILKEMKQKGRYNIKKATNYGIKIEKTKDPKSKEFEAFWQLTKETTKRDNFSSNPKVYYNNLLIFLNSKNIETYLYSAYFENKIIASAICVFYKNKATYYYGASSSKHRNLMAPYLLQWEMIKDAKKNNMKIYDFLGILPSYYEEDGNYIINDSFNRIKFKKQEAVENFLNTHNFSGIAEFKTKFGGEIINYMGSCDLIYDKFWYSIIKISKKIRKLKRKII
jgi:lipid II:glycine glycyltransferase (peptidoglycan interpeptide bridge formation enzyme)